MRRTYRVLVSLLAVLALIMAACGDDDDTTTRSEVTDETTGEVTETPESTETPETSAEVVEADPVAAFCDKNAEVLEVRLPVYSPPWDETPEEIEAMLAESLVLNEEVNAMVPAEIEEVWLEHFTEFNLPIDALTEANGWNPLAAVNTPEAMAIFNDPDLNASAEQITAYLDEHCNLRHVLVGEVYQDFVTAMNARDVAALEAMLDPDVVQESIDATSQGFGILPEIVGRDAVIENWQMGWEFADPMITDWEMVGIEFGAPAGNTIITNDTVTHGDGSVILNKNGSMTVNEEGLIVTFGGDVDYETLEEGTGTLGG